jgi:hypothetical protein
MMKAIRSWFTMGIVFLLCGCSAVGGSAENMGKQPASIGVATMSEDGVIRLQLMARGDGAVGDAILVYKPGDPMYEEVKKHIGGLKPGEEKPVPPWPARK